MGLQISMVERSRIIACPSPAPWPPSALASEYRYGAHSDARCAVSSLADSPASRSCFAPSRPICLESPMSQVSQRAGCTPALEGRRMVPLTDSMAPAQSVLIIDDEAVNRRLAQVMFQKLGWEVETVDSGDRALLHLAARRYDLILLDISMPGMTGLEVCQHIRADPRLMALRVIAYTAHALLEQQQRFLASGFDAVLLKPISFRAVQELIMAQTPCS